MKPRRYGREAVEGAETQEDRNKRRKPGILLLRRSKEGDIRGGRCHPLAGSSCRNHLPQNKRNEGAWVRLDKSLSRHAKIVPITFV